MAVFSHLSGPRTVLALVRSGATWEDQLRMSPIPPCNIVPLHPFVNTGSYKQAEKVAIDAANQGSCNVCVRITFNYDRTFSYPGRPTMFTYEVWVDGNKVGNASDQNKLS
jgi:hypothetical protein